MPGEPGQAPPPAAAEAWPSVAPFGEAGQISASIIVLAFLCSSAGSTFASKGGKNHTWPPTAQTTGLDRVSDPGIAARSPEPGIRCGRTPRGRAAPVIDGRQRHTSWPTLITSSGRHIMRRSMRQAPSAASTRPPRRTAVLGALSMTWPVTQRDVAGLQEPSLLDSGNLADPSGRPWWSARHNGRNLQPRWWHRDVCR